MHTNPDDRSEATDLDQRLIHCAKCGMRVIPAAEFEAAIGEMSPAVSPNEAAALLGVSRQTIHALINRGELRRFKVGRLTRIPRVDVLALVGAGNFHHGGYLTRRAMGDPKPAEVIDAAYLAHQREWSRETFGPGARTLGVLDHIRKELAEIEADPTDVNEWVDVIILALDGAWRAGWEPQQILDAIAAKQARNEARTWPAWRTMSEDQAIEHDRSGESKATLSDGDAS